LPKNVQADFGKSPPSSFLFKQGHRRPGVAMASMFGKDVKVVDIGLLFMATEPQKTHPPAGILLSNRKQILPLRFESHRQ